MRYTTPIAIALLASCVAFNVQAADNSSEPCSLLDWHDFQSLGAVKDTTFVNSGWQPGETPKEIPDSELLSNICTAAIGSPKGGLFIALSIDGFKGKVSEQQVSDWLKSVAAADSKQSELAIVQVGNATCESGQYDVPTKQKDGSNVNVVKEYIACDRQVETRHIALNLHVAEDQKGELPSPEQTAALLDKSILRMKQQTFAPSDEHHNENVIY